MSDLFAQVSLDPSVQTGDGRGKPGELFQEQDSNADSNAECCSGQRSAPARVEQSEQFQASQATCVGSLDEHLDSIFEDVTSMDVVSGSCQRS